MVRLGDVIEAKYGKALPQPQRRGGDAPVYGSNGVVGWHDTAITAAPVIVIGRKGSFGEVNFSNVPCWPIDTTYFIDDPGPYKMEFLEQLLRSLGLTRLDQSTAIPGLSRDQLYDIKVPVPSVREQDKISELVGAVEEKRSSSLDHLSVARRVIERFRQAVLAAACSGRLTADWREGHPDAPSVEHALTEMQQRRTRRGRREEVVDLELPELPGSYVIAPLGDSATILDYGTSRRSDATAENGIPVLRMGNIQDGQLDLADLKYMSVDREVESLLLQSGDLLFNRTNSPELVGKSAVYYGTEPMTFASYLIRVRFNPEVALPQYVNFWIDSAWGRLWAHHVKTDGVSQSNINGTKLARLPLPLPPVEEQREIVRRASELLTTADRLLGQVERAARSVKRSTQAVLAKTFRGELVPTEAE